GSRDKRRQHEYATVQQLWEKEPKQLATLVVEDRLSDIEQRRQPELPPGDQNNADPKRWQGSDSGSQLAADYCQLNPSQTVLGVIDESLRGNIELSRAQKGFTHDEGAAQNVSLFRQTLKAMKEEQGGTCSILDISKAFDTVPHGALVPALRRLGVAPISLNTSITYTRIVRRGVKQGDPLSPLLWNAVVDPLLTYLDQREGKGIVLGGRNVSVLAFADDLILISKSEGDAVEDIELVSEYFSALGMNLSIAKCSAFTVNRYIKLGLSWTPSLRSKIRKSIMWTQTKRSVTSVSVSLLGKEEFLAKTTRRNSFLLQKGGKT
ncbi:unnamed protein product, partial [Acanthoscelides obtectus]